MIDISADVSADLQLSIEDLNRDVDELTGTDSKKDWTAGLGEPRRLTVTGRYAVCRVEAHTPSSAHDRVVSTEIQGCSGTAVYKSNHMGKVRCTAEIYSRRAIVHQAALTTQERHRASLMRDLERFQRMMDGFMGQLAQLEDEAVAHELNTRINNIEAEIAELRLDFISMDRVDAAVLREMYAPRMHAEEHTGTQG